VFVARHSRGLNWPDTGRRRPKGVSALDYAVDLALCDDLQHAGVGQDGDMPVQAAGWHVPEFFSELGGSERPVPEEGFQYPQPDRVEQKVSARHRPQVSEVLTRLISFIILRTISVLQGKVAVVLNSLKTPFGDSGSRANRRRGATVGACLALSLTVAPCAMGSGSAAAQVSTVSVPKAQDDLSLAWALPNFPVGRQLRWLLTAATQPPIPSAELKAHFDTSFLAAVPPATVNETVEALGLKAPLRLTSLDAGLTPSVLDASFSSGTTAYGLIISVDAHGLISGVRISPYPPPPSAPISWAGIDAQLRSLAPQVSFEAATLVPTSKAGAAGKCQVLNSVDPASPRPLGSMFKLYVLATVASDVRSGRLSWDQEIPLTASLRSLPSGFLQVQPAGTRYTVSQLAQIMVPDSDNTAADRLAALVGREAVEAEVAATSANASLDDPFLRTRELFVLKYANYPHYAKAYLRLSTAQKTAYLDQVVDHVPLSNVDLKAAGIAAPRNIGSIEWFASAADICALYSQLFADASSPSLAPVSTALSYNDGGIDLSRSTWPLVWYKGGSESGVLTLAFLARRSDGAVAVVALELSDPTAPIPAAASLKALADIRAAFDLVPLSGT
jgi:hypothetical protein